MSQLYVITGANGAHGQEIAHYFANQGHRLILTDIQTELRSEHASVITQTVKYIAADLSNPSALTSLCDEILKIGVPDGLINNAGVFPFDDIFDISLDQMSATLAINLQAPFFLMQQIGSIMAKHGKGSICNISSASASVSRRNGAVYGASKAGLEQLTKTFAIILGPLGVRVNAVRPGLRAHQTLQAVPMEHAKNLELGVPLQRFSRPGEIARLIHFLSSDEASFITGQIISVDGGSDLNRRR